MIPKVIHCIWLGGNDLPALEKKCISSWRNNLPDYEIKFWDESNYSPNNKDYQSAFKKKQWAFCADYARMDILLNHGGIYLDTDMEIIKTLDPFLVHNCFLGKESDVSLSCGIIGAKMGDPFIADCFEEVKKSLSTDFIPIPKIFNFVYKKGGYEDVKVYEKEFFYPYNPFAYPLKNLMFMDITTDTHAIHHWSYSWKPSLTERVFNKIKRTLFSNKILN